MALSEPPLKEVAVVNIGDPKDSYQVTLSSNIAAVRKRVLRFGIRGVRRAEFRALNRAAGQTLTLIKRDISESFNLAQKHFKSHLSIKQANFSTLFVAITGRGNQIGIIKAKGAKRQTPTGVRVNTGGGSAVKKGTFLATMPNGKVGVFQREPQWQHKGPFTSKDRGVKQFHGLGIAELKYPPVARMLTNRKRANSAFDNFTTFYEKRLLANLNAEADKQGARRG